MSFHFLTSILYDPDHHLSTDPPIVSFNERGTISVKDGTDCGVQFAIISDPSLETGCVPHLSMDNGPISYGRVHIEGGMVLFKRVRSSDAGRYTISSFNAAGQGKASFQLRVIGKFNHTIIVSCITSVLYYTVAPVYILEPDYLKVPAGSSPCVTFTVTSDPPLPEDVRHTLSKEGGGAVSRRFKVQNNQITFHDVALEDRGQYIFSCRNEDGEEGQGVIELKVIDPVQLSSQQCTTPDTSKEQ